MRARQGPWTAFDEAFPHDAPTAERLRFLLHYALLAPSSHNTQPWRFRIGEDTVELFADRERALPVLDPMGRELTISCGASLAHFTVAARHFGYLTNVSLLPEPSSPNLLARVSLGARQPSTRGADRLFYAMARQRAHSLAFSPRPLPPALRTALVSAASRAGIWCDDVDEPWKREIVANLVAEGDIALFADPAFRRELARWTRSGPTRRVDGMPAHVLGLGRAASYVAPLVVQRFDFGRQQADQHRRQILEAPLVLLLGTTADDARAWLTTGIALTDLLLLAYAEGVSAAFMNQPVEVVTLRNRLTSWLQSQGCPQMILRLGYGSPVDPAQRRPLAEVLMP